MKKFTRRVMSVFILTTSICAGADIQLGPRPLYLVNAMDDSPLKTALADCSAGPFRQSEFSIGHRGAPLQFPEHTRESYVAAASMGAGIVECDVTFTRDQELVCRHSQCDLHTTTNILTVPELAAKCTKPFTPAKLDPTSGKILSPASAKCCASDLSVEEFLSLKGKMDASDQAAQTVEEYQGGTASFRTDLYTGSGTLMTHAESIELFKSLGVKMTPELKAAQVEMPFDGSYTQERYAQQLVDEYRAAGIAPENVWMQSFNLKDIEFWIKNSPEFGKQAVYLDGRYSAGMFDPSDESSWNPGMQDLSTRGINYLAPPMWVLLDQATDGSVQPSVYATKASEAGLNLITWTLERSGLLSSGGGWYYQSIKSAIKGDGDVYEVLHVLAKDVGVKGVFSDWPATVTYYANCFDE